MNVRLLLFTLCLYLAGIVVAQADETAPPLVTVPSKVATTPNVAVPPMVSKQQHRNATRHIVTPNSLATPKLVYEGTWVTTNRPLDGRMTCELQAVGKEKWRAHFEGIWQGVAFDYTVHFTGPDSALRCDTKVDGAAYVAHGVLTAEHFKARFGGDRYEGSLTMKRVKGDIKPAPRPESSAVRSAPRPQVRTSRPPTNVAR